MGKLLTNPWLWGFATIALLSAAGGTSSPAPTPGPGPGPDPDPDPAPDPDPLPPDLDGALEVYPGAWEVNVGQLLWLRGGGDILSIQVLPGVPIGETQGYTHVAGGLMNQNWYIRFDKPGTWNVTIKAEVAGPYSPKITRQWELTAV